MLVVHAMTKNTVFQIFVVMGLISMVIRGIWLGWDWFESWLTDWWAWGFALAVFVGLETIKRLYVRRKVPRA
jgi:hypothetical protein